MKRKAPKEVSKQELYRLVGKKAKSYSSTMAEVYINALIEVILEELILSGKINVRNLGIFEAVECGGYDKMMPSPTYDGLQNKYIAPHFKINFRPSKNVSSALNNRKLLSATKRQQQMYNDKLQKIIDEEAEEYENRNTNSPRDVARKWKVLQKQKEIEKEIIKQENLRKEEEIDFKSRRHYSDGRRSMRKVDK